MISPMTWRSQIGTAAAGWYGAVSVLADVAAVRRAQVLCRCGWLGQGQSRVAAVILRGLRQGYAFRV